MRLALKVGLSALTITVLAGLSACSGEKEEVVLTEKQETATIERLEPAGEVTLESDVVVTAASVDAGGGEPRSGEEIYNKSCTTCHTPGVAGAPKLGDVAGWAPRIEKGMDTLYTHAIQGFNGMPPRGLCMDCTDEEIHASVDYMVEQSQ